MGGGGGGYWLMSLPLMFGSRKTCFSGKSVMGAFGGGAGAGGFGASGQNENNTGRIWGAPFFFLSLACRRRGRKVATHQMLRTVLLLLLILLLLGAREIVVPQHRFRS